MWTHTHMYTVHLHTYVNTHPSSGIHYRNGCYLPALPKSLCYRKCQVAWTSPLNCLPLSVHSPLLGWGSAVFSHNYLVSVQNSLPVRWPSPENLNGHRFSHVVPRINKYRYSPFDPNPDVCLYWKELLQSGFFVNNHIDWIPDHVTEQQRGKM